MTSQEANSIPLGDINNEKPWCGSVGNCGSCSE